MTQLSLWLGAQALLQDIEGWGHPRAGSLQATLDLSFKSWANLFGDLHLALGVKFWTIPLLILCLCDHTVLVVGVFVCVDWIGKSHSGLCRMGKFYLHHPTHGLCSKCFFLIYSNDSFPNFIKISAETSLPKRTCPKPPNRKILNSMSSCKNHTVLSFSWFLFS